MRAIQRPYYLDWLKRWRDKDVIKVVTGMRRCGKSTILELFQTDLAQSGVPRSNIISINFETKLEEDYPLTAKELYGYVVARLGKGGVTYVFLDEIQQVEHFEEVVDALYARDDVDLYITGSNAYFLSGELATYLTGRYVEIRVFPFSFKEYYTALEELYTHAEGAASSSDSSLEFTPEPLPSKEEAFNRYLTRGGLPFAARLSNERDIIEYLEGVFNTIFVKDIAKRRPRMDMNALRATASFLADNIGNISSIKRISDGLTERNNKISQGAVGQYLSSLNEAYLLFMAGRFDLKGKEYLKTLEKYYLGDLGFRFWLLGKSAGDVGRRIENVVYLELLRIYDHVFVGKQEKQEVDFVASRGDKTHYYQVAQTVLDERVLKRELSPLQSIEDNYPKTLLTLDRIGTGDISGIKHKNLIDWLLE